jgi:hypothetical protein
MSGSQTTGAINFTDNALSISINGAAYVDICGESNALSLSGGDRDIAEFFTYCGDTPIILPGKRKKIELKIKAAYTEGASDPEELIRQAYETKGTTVAVKWAPKGGQQGEFVYTSAAGYVSTPPYPMGSADSADITAFEFSVHVPYVTKSVAP